MATATHTLQVRLARRELLTLDPHARRVFCEAGSLWITQDRDPRDILLEAGDTFTPEPGRRAIVYALSAATLGVEHDAPEPTVLPQRRRAGRPSAHSLVLE